MPLAPVELTHTPRTRIIGGVHLVHCVVAGPEHARQLASHAAHVAEALGRYAPAVQPAPQDLSRRSRLLTSSAGQAWRVNGGEMGGFGGAQLEHPRQWRGAQWPSLSLGVPSRPEPPGAP